VAVVAIAVVALAVVVVVAVVIVPGNKKYLEAYWCIASVCPSVISAEGLVAKTS